MPTHNPLQHDTMPVKTHTELVESLKNIGRLAKKVDEQFHAGAFGPLDHMESLDRQQSSGSSNTSGATTPPGKTSPFKY